MRKQQTEPGYQPRQVTWITVEVDVELLRRPTRLHRQLGGHGHRPSREAVVVP